MREPPSQHGQREMQLPGHQPPRYGKRGPAGDIWWQVAGGRWQLAGSRPPDPSVMRCPQPRQPHPGQTPPAAGAALLALPSSFAHQPTRWSRRCAANTLPPPRPTPPLLGTNPVFARETNAPPLRRPRFFPPAILRPEPIIPAHNSSQPPPAACQAWSAHPALVCAHSVHGPRNPSRHPDSFPRPPLIRAYRARFLPESATPPGEESR